MDTVGAVLILVGSVFALIAGLGQLRFGDVFVRMHIATKPATLGLALVLSGAVLRVDGVAPATKLGLAIALQFLTAPVSAHLVGRAAYQAGAGDDVELVVDDLAGLHPAADPPDGPDPQTRPTSGGTSAGA